MSQRTEFILNVMHKAINPMLKADARSLGLEIRDDGVIVPTQPLTKDEIECLEEGGIKFSSPFDLTQEQWKIND